MAHVARYLAAASSAAGGVVGTVWCRRDPTARALSLLLLPPRRRQRRRVGAEEEEGTDADDTNESGDGKDDDETAAIPRRSKRSRVGKRNPLAARRQHCFRLRIDFQLEHLDWIPLLRLVPNRCNVPSPPSRPDDGAAPAAPSASSVHYNALLTADARHLWFHHHDDSHHNDDVDDGDGDDGGDDHVGGGDSSGGRNNSGNDTLQQPQFIAAQRLLQLWALQRGLLRGHDTLSAEHILVLLLYLVRTKRVHARMAAVPLVTAFFKLLAETVWLLPETNDGHDDVDGSNINSNGTSGHTSGGPRRPRRSVLVMPAAVGQTLAHTVAAAALARVYAQSTRESPLTTTATAAADPPTLLQLYAERVETPVLLDPSLRHNWLSALSPASMRTLQQQAAASLQCLHGPQTDGSSHGSNAAFVQCFMTEARFWTRHDAHLRIPLSAVSFGISSLWGADRADLGRYESFARGLVRLLRRALGDRVLNVQLLSTGNGDPTKPATTAAVPADSDEIPTFAVDAILSQGNDGRRLQSPTGANYAVLGVTINPDACYRAVDRGPPPAQAAALRDFVELWGPKAELRRFKDGAIVHAVVWDASTDNGNDDDHSNGYHTYQNDDSWQGGIVERIIRHVLKRHFLRSDDAVANTLQFSLRDIVSTVDGVKTTTTSSTAASLLSNPLAAHRAVMKAFESLANVLRKTSALTVPVPGSATAMTSKLGIPLPIDAVEALSPALRYAALYPPVPHPLLGAAPAPGQQKASGAVQSDPIAVQIRFGSSSKWPNDLKAIGAAKTAMLIGLVNGIEALKTSHAGYDDDDGVSHNFEGPMIVTPTYADICFSGYVFRVFVRADPEIKLLRSLRTVRSPESASLLQSLTRTTVAAATHHSMVHAVYTSHPSSSATVRVAQRWLSTHLLSPDHIPLEAVELTVAHVYTHAVAASTPLAAPGTVTSGFLRWLHLLATHNWARQPLVVDPQGHLSHEDHRAIQLQFAKARGEFYDRGPAMYILSPWNYGHQDDDADADADDGSTGRMGGGASWSPSFTTNCPERVVLSRAVALAERTHAFLCALRLNFDDSAWPGAFAESTASFRSYSALLRVDPGFAVNAEASSSALSRSLLVAKNKSEEWESTYTRSMRSLAEGPKALRKKLYRNLMVDDDDGLLLEWRPMAETVRALRAKIGRLALVFYNDLCPEVLAVVWRPLSPPRPFSAVTSEHARPVTGNDRPAEPDALVTLNVGDVLRDMACLTVDTVVDVKVFDRGLPPMEPSSVVVAVKRKHTTDDANSDDSES